MLTFFRALFIHKSQRALVVDLHKHNVPRCLTLCKHKTFNLYYFKYYHQKLT